MLTNGEQGRITGIERVLLVLLCGMAAVVLMPPPVQDVLYYVQEREHATRLLAGLAGMVLCWGWITGRLRVRFGPGRWLLVAFAAHAALSVAWSVDRAAALESAHGAACWLAAAASAAALFRNPAAFRAFFRFAAVLSLCVCALGLLERAGLATELMPDVDSLDQIASTLGYPSVYAGWLTAMLFLVWSGAAAARGAGDKWLGAAAALLLIVNLRLCGSWAAMGVCAAGAAAVLVQVRTRAKRLVPAALLALLIAGAALPWAASFPGLRADWGGKADSMGLRVMKWRVATAMANDRPLTGRGAGQYQVHYPDVRARLGLRRAAWETRPDIYYPVASDNDFAMRAAEQGWPGAALFAMVLGWTVWVGFAARPGGDARRAHAVIAAGAGVFAIAGYGMFHFPFEAAGVWFPAWCCAAAVWALREPDEDNIEKPGAARLPLRVVQATVFMGCAYMAYLPAAGWANDAAMRRGTRAAALGDMREAERIFNRPMPAAPRSWRFNYYHGNAMLVSGSAKAAHAPLRRAARQRPYNLLVLRRLHAALSRNPGAMREAAALESRMRRLDAPPVVPGEPVQARPPLK